MSWTKLKTETVKNGGVKMFLSVVCAINNVFMQFGVDYIKLHSPFTKKKVVYVTKLINSQYLLKILF